MTELVGATLAAHKFQAMGTHLNSGKGTHLYFWYSFNDEECPLTTRNVPNGYSQLIKRKVFLQPVKEGSPYFLVVTAELVVRSRN